MENIGGRTAPSPSGNDDRAPQSVNENYLEMHEIHLSGQEECENSKPCAPATAPNSMVSSHRSLRTTPVKQPLPQMRDLLRRGEEGSATSPSDDPHQEKSQTVEESISAIPDPSLGNRNCCTAVETPSGIVSQFRANYKQAAQPVVSNVSQRENWKASTYESDDVSPGICKWRCAFAIVVVAVVIAHAGAFYGYALVAEAFFQPTNTYNATLRITNYTNIRSQVKPKDWVFRSQTDGTLAALQRQSLGPKFLSILTPESIDLLLRDREASSLLSSSCFVDLSAVSIPSYFCLVVLQYSNSTSSEMIKITSQAKPAEVVNPEETLYTATGEELQFLSPLMQVSETTSTSAPHHVVGCVFSQESGISVLACSNESCTVSPIVSSPAWTPRCQGTVAGDGSVLFLTQHATEPSASPTIKAFSFSRQLSVLQQSHYQPHWNTSAVDLYTDKEFSLMGEAFWNETSVNVRIEELASSISTVLKMQFSFDPRGTGCADLVTVSSYPFALLLVQKQSLNIADHLQEVILIQALLGSWLVSYSQIGLRTFDISCKPLWDPMKFTVGHIGDPMHELKSSSDLAFSLTPVVVASRSSGAAQMWVLKIPAGLSLLHQLASSVEPIRVIGHVPRSYDK